LRGEVEVDAADPRVEHLRVEVAER
jgi:hypothetical protein